MADPLFPRPEPGHIVTIYAASPDTTRVVCSCGIAVDWPRGRHVESVRSEMDYRHMQAGEGA